MHMVSLIRFTSRWWFHWILFQCLTLNKSSVSCCVWSRGFAHNIVVNLLHICVRQMVSGVEYTLCLVDKNISHLKKLHYSDVAWPSRRLSFTDNSTVCLIITSGWIKRTHLISASNAQSDVVVSKQVSSACNHILLDRFFFTNRCNFSGRKCMYLLLRKGRKYLLTPRSYSCFCWPIGRYGTCISTRS